jgi:hypothetical protein
MLRKWIAVFVGDAHAGVRRLEVEFGCGAVLCRQRYHDSYGSCRRELDGVAYQIDYHLTQARGVSTHGVWDVWQDFAGE